MLDVVVFLVSLGVRVIRAMCRRRADLALENVALRQQVTALKKERPRPPVPSIYSSARTELAKLLIYGLFRKIRVLAQDGLD